MEKKIIEIAAKHDRQEIMERMFGKPFKMGKLSQLIEETNYEFLGTGVINKSILNNADGRKLLDNIEQNFIPIETQENFDNFNYKLSLIKKENEENTIKENDLFYCKLMETVEKNVPENTKDEDKNAIIEIVSNCSTNKKELGDDFNKVRNIVKTHEKTRNIFNVKPGIKINKNDFAKKDNNKEENK